LEDFQYVIEHLFFAIIAAQCGDNHQCWFVDLSLELDRCHKRLHFAAWHNFARYVGSIDPTDLLLSIFPQNGKLLITGFVTNILR